MRVLTKQEGDEWLMQACGRTLTDMLVDHGQTEARSYALPVDSGCKTSLARNVAAACRMPCLLWIDETKIWPSSENRPLTNLLRKAVGEVREVEDAPVHLFEAAEDDDLMAFLSAVLYQFWGALLVEPDSGRSWRVSHDEWMTIAALNGAKVDEAATMLESLELRRLR